MQYITLPHFFYRLQGRRPTRGFISSLAEEYGIDRDFLGLAIGLPYQSPQSGFAGSLIEDVQVFNPFDPEGLSQQQYESVINDIHNVSDISTDVTPLVTDESIQTTPYDYIDDDAFETFSLKSLRGNTNLADVLRVQYTQEELLRIKEQLETGVKRAMFQGNEQHVQRDLQALSDLTRVDEAPEPVVVPNIYTSSEDFDIQTVSNVPIFDNEVIIENETEPDFLELPQVLLDDDDDDDDEEVSFDELESEDVTKRLAYDAQITEAQFLAYVKSQSPIFFRRVRVSDLNEFIRRSKLVLNTEVYYEVLAGDGAIMGLANSDHSWLMSTIITDLHYLDLLDLMRLYDGSLTDLDEFELADVQVRYMLLSSYNSEYDEATTGQAVRECKYFKEYEDEKIFLPGCQYNECLTECFKKAFPDSDVKVFLPYLMYASSNLQSLNSLNLKLKLEDQKTIRFSAFKTNSPTSKNYKNHYVGYPMVQDQGSECVDFLFVEVEDLIFHCMYQKSYMTNREIRKVLVDNTCEPKYSCSDDNFAIKHTSIPFKHPRLIGFYDTEWFHNFETKNNIIYAVGFSLMSYPKFKVIKVVCSNLFYNPSLHGEKHYGCKDHLGETMFCGSCESTVDNMTGVSMKNHFNMIASGKCNEVMVRCTKCHKKAEHVNFKYNTTESKVEEKLSSVLPKTEIYYGEDCFKDSIETMFDFCNKLAYMSYAEVNKRDKEINLTISMYAYNGAKADSYFVPRVLGDGWIIDPKKTLLTNKGFLSLCIKKLHNSELSEQTVSKLSKENGMTSEEIRSLPFFVVIQFLDCMKFCAGGTLSSNLKKANLPEKFLKGDFDHRQMRDCWDVMMHEEECVEYLRRDVEGMIIWFAMLEFSMEKTLVYGNDRHMVMSSHLTLPTLASNFVMQKAKENDDIFSVAVLKNTKEPGVGNLKDFVTKFKLGAKCEAFRCFVGLDETVDFDITEYELVMGMNIRDSFLHMLCIDFMLMWDEYPEHLKNVCKNIIKCMDSKCSKDCYHIQFSSVEEFERNECIEAFERIVYTNKHYKVKGCVILACIKTYRIMFKGKMTRLKKMIRIIMEAERKTIEFKKSLIKNDETKDRFTSLDCNSLYPSAMILYKKNMPTASCHCYYKQPELDEFMRMSVDDVNEGVYGSFITAIAEGKKISHKPFFYSIDESLSQELKCEYLGISLYGGDENKMSYIKPTNEDFVFPKIKWFSLWIVDMEYDKTKTPFTSALGVKGGGHLYWTLGKIKRGHYSCFDIECALRQGWKVTQVHSGLVIYCRDSIGKSMEHLFEERLKMKKNKDEKEQIIKLMMNSCYGKFGQIDCSQYKLGTYKDLSEDNSLHQATLKILNEQIDCYQATLIEKKSFDVPVQMSCFVLTASRYHMHLCNDAVGILSQDVYKMESIDKIKIAYMGH